MCPSHSTNSRPDVFVLFLVRVFLLGLVMPIPSTTSTNSNWIANAATTHLLLDGPYCVQPATMYRTATLNLSSLIPFAHRPNATNTSSSPVVLLRDLSLRIRSGHPGLRCTGTSLYSPFGCREYNSIGLVCAKEEGTAINWTSSVDWNHNGTATRALVSTNQSVGSGDELTLGVYRLLPLTQQCNVVYLPRYWDWDETRSSVEGTACFDVYATVVASTDAPSSVLPSQGTPLPSCFTHTAESVCDAYSSFCRWAPNSLTCCPIRSLGGAAVTDPRCDCPLVDTTTARTSSHVNPSCRVGSSQLFTRNLISRYCSMWTRVSLKQCGDELFRCTQPSLSLPASTKDELVNMAMARTCERSGFRTCVDPSLSCTQTTITEAPVPPGVLTTGMPPVALLGTVTTTTPSVFIEAVQAGTATIALSLLVGTEWNETAFNDTQLLQSAFTAEEVKFGFNAEKIIRPGAVRFLSRRDVIITLGPHHLRPEKYESWLRFHPPLQMFDTSVSDTTAVTFQVIRPRPSTFLVNATNILASSAALGTLVSGASGWLGLATIQTNMLMATIQCAELETRALFPNAVYIVTPWRYVQDNHRFVYLIGLCTAAFTLVVHGVAILIHKVVWNPRILRESLRATWFPYLYFYFIAVSLVGITQTAFTGLIDDQTPYVRVLFGLTDVVFTAIFLWTWGRALRKGFEGFYVAYGDDRSEGKEAGGEGGADGRSVEDEGDVAERRANYGSIFAARWVEVKETIRTGGIQRFCRKGALHWFKPRGHWPSARGYTAIREQCHNTGSSFTLLSVIFFFLAGVNASHESDDRIFCYAVYWDYVLLGAVYFVLFFFFQPFRVPFLNLLWGVSHLLEMIMYGIASEWILADDPAKDDGARISQMAIAVLLTQSLFNAYVLFVTVVERIMYYGPALQRWCNTDHAVENKTEKGQCADDEMEGGHPRDASPSLAFPRSRHRLSPIMDGVQHRHSFLGASPPVLPLTELVPSSTWDSPEPAHGPPSSLSPPLTIRQRSQPGGGLRSAERWGAGRSPSPTATGPAGGPWEEREHTMRRTPPGVGSTGRTAGGGPQPHNPLDDVLADQPQAHAPPPPPSASTSALLDRRQRVVVELGPIPPDLEGGHILNTFLVYNAVGCEMIGATAFIHFQTLRDGLGATVAFHRRVFEGGVVDCRVVSPAGVDRSNLL